MKKATLDRRVCEGMTWNKRQSYLRLIKEVGRAHDDFRNVMVATTSERKRARTLAAKRLMQRSRELWAFLGTI